jgi:membrane associated rhomboid family serine protease
MPVTYIIIAITVGISFLAWSRPNVMATCIFNPYFVSQRRQYHRFISSGFVHQHHMHLLLNMLSFYFFGVAVEYEFYLLFGESSVSYLLAIIVSEIPTYLKHKNDAHYNSLGASGGVSAIIFAFIIFKPLADIYLYFALPIPGFILGTLYIIFSWYQGRKSNDNINHDAHLYGALFGLVFCAVVYPQSIPQFFDQIVSWRPFLAA